MTRLMIFVLLLVCLASPLRAQSEADATAGSGRTGFGGDATLEVLQFGIDGKARPGSWAGIQLAITYNGDVPRDAIVELQLVDADGDRPLYQVSTPLTPKKRHVVWLYALLPTNLLPNRELTARVFDATRIENTANPDLPEFRAGAQLSELRFTVPATTPENTQRLVGVVGRGTPIALNQYEFLGVTQGSDHEPTGHELTRIIDNLSPRDLPDRWMGFDAYESIVWSSGAPSSLISEQADAIREWVYRGGHLIVLVPMAGQAWIGAPTNPLADLMPNVTVEDGPIDLQQLSRQLTLRKKMVPDHITASDEWWQQSAQYFIPEEDPGYANCRILMSDPVNNNRHLVVRRIVGRGAVTLIGLDLMNTTLRRHDVVEADIFWHRIFGRRTNIIDIREKKQMESDGKLTGLHSRQEVWVDAVLGKEINIEGKAMTGLLLAFLVFASYWLIAGPVGYFVLRERRKKHHAWLAFFLATATFTGIAWGGATLLRPTKVEGKHVTLIDHVYGQPLQGARMWAGVLLPRYGDIVVSVDSETVSGIEPHNAISPWQGVEELPAQFPDARGYAVNASKPSAIRVPARATVKEFQVDWLGMSDWSMPRPYVDGTPPLGQEIRLTKVGPKTVPIGQLIHELPAPLERVKLILVLGTRDAAPPALQVETQAVALPTNQAWPAGEPIDLERLFADSKSADDYFRRSVNPDPDALRRRSLDKRLDAQAFFSVLEPPELGRGQEPLYRRRSTHGWDLGRWFTEPCLIVVGQVRDTQSPVALRVGGSDPETVRSRVKGTTVVRWVYPLAINSPPSRSIPTDRPTPRDRP